MKILFYLHRYPAFGGIETVTTMLASQFQKRGHQVRIVSFHSMTGTGQLDQLTEGTFLKLPNTNPRADENVKELSRLLGEFGPDVIIYQDSYADFGGCLWRALGGVEKRPLVLVAEHSAPMFDFKAPSREYGASRLKRISFYLCPIIFYLRRYYYICRRRRTLNRHCDGYVVLSPHYIRPARALCGWFGVKPIFVIPNPVPAISCCPKTDKEKMVLFVSTMNDDNKGLSRLLSIWRDIAPRHPDWSFEVLGDGLLKTSYEERVQREHISNVHFRGYVTNTLSFYEQASIFVMASRREGWPMVLGEAMLHGAVPIVYDSFGSVFDIIDNNKNGFIIPHYRQKAYSLVLDKLMTDDALRSQMAIAAQYKVSSNFDCDRVAKMWLRLFEAERR